MSFVNTLPYISNPIEEFKDYRFVDWESGIYPTFKAGTDPEEIHFFTDLIQSQGLRKILDLGVGGGVELADICKNLKKYNYPVESIEANEVDATFIQLAHKHFQSQELKILIHKANWLDLPKAEPPYTHNFDFAFLTGNSLTYIGGGTREYTKRAQQSVVSKFSGMIDKGGYLFIDSRNYDYIYSLMNLSREEIFENFTFPYSIYYHGFQEKILVFPAYISDTVVVLHYYDKEKRVWSKLDLYPIYQKDMLDILSKDFEVEKVIYDFGKGSKDKSLFVQYLVRRK
ncbi:MAG: class I SAM-dependent methyltransferase [Patescibacteria group bacterium]|jgi:hypothetical protein|nr:class I SAM-dependent methyltransferase [Patescibacteria group bacterium]